MVIHLHAKGYEARSKDKKVLARTSFAEKKKKKKNKNHYKNNMSPFYEGET